MENLTIGQIIEVLPFISSQHSRNSKEYKTFETITDYVVKNSNLKLKKMQLLIWGAKSVRLIFHIKSLGQ